MIKTLAKQSKKYIKIFCLSVNLEAYYKSTTTYIKEKLIKMQSADQPIKFSSSVLQNAKRDSVQENCHTVLKLWS